MQNALDIAIILAYFAILLGVGFWKGRKSRESSAQYFFSRKTLPWWVIGMAYVAAGMNAEQLVGQNGVGYKHGLVMVNWYYTILIPVYTALIVVFFPLYLRNNIRTMPEFLGRRFNKASESLFAFLLLLSYIFMSLAVAFYGGAKILNGIFPAKEIFPANFVPNVRMSADWTVDGGLIFWLLALALIAGLYTMWGGMASMVYTAVVQFVLIFAGGFFVFYLCFRELPHGLADVKAVSANYFHLIQPLDHELIPWPAVLLTIFGLHLFYSCMNQSMVQRGFGARSEWDVRIAVILVGFAVFFRPFIEILPGMMARALFLAGVRPEFALQGKTVDDVYPLIIRTLVKPGLKGIVLCGVLSAVLAAISALLGSISTLLTFDVYKRWLRKTAGDRELVRVGVVATLLLMVFAVVYAPIVERLGGIFIYFQTTATLLAVPVATVFLFGIFWRRATPAAALATLLVGIPSGFLLMVLLGAVGFGRQETPWLYERLPGLIGFLHAHLPLADPAWLKSWGLDNFFVESGINQAMLCVLMVAVSLATRPRPLAEIRPLLWTKEVLFLPKDEPKRPLWQSVGLWWVVFASFYLVLIFCLW